MPTIPAKGFRSTQISSVGAGAADPPCDGERWDGLMSAPRDPWWQSRESGRQACVAPVRWGSHQGGMGRGEPRPQVRQHQMQGKKEQSKVFRRCLGGGQRCPWFPTSPSSQHRVTGRTSGCLQDPVLQGTPSLPPSRDRALQGVPVAQLRAVLSPCRARWGHEPLRGTGLGTPLSPAEVALLSHCGHLHPSGGGRCVEPGTRVLRTPSSPGCPRAASDKGDTAAGEGTRPPRRCSFRTTPEAPLHQHCAPPHCPSPARPRSHWGQPGGPSAGWAPG